MTTHYLDGARRRPKASAKQLLGLLRIRLGVVSANVGRIKGIDQRLRKLGIRLPRSMMPPLPDASELRNASAKLLDKVWDLPEQKRIRRHARVPLFTRAAEIPRKSQNSGRFP